MSVVDRFGIRISLAVREKPDIYEDRTIEKARSLEMAARVRSGWPVQKVARYFNVHRTTVWRRIRAVPADSAERTAGIVG
jgi:transcriptional regulator of acetoin/glycerol metabolism